MTNKPAPSSTRLGTLQSHIRQSALSNALLKYRRILRDFSNAKPKLFLATVLISMVLLVGGLTALVYLNRAGSDLDHNWAVGFNLLNSDNSVLFQLSDDIARGRSLNWSFSPQVYVFPELPISLVSYFLGHGNAQFYYLIVAIINGSLLFLGLYCLVRVLFKDRSAIEYIKRAFLATIPLLALPLLCQNALFAYHLFPTYYFGIYLMIIMSPIIFLAESKKRRWLVGIMYGLTAASNPLLILLTLPAFIIVMMFKFFRDGWRPVLKPAAWAVAILAASTIVRKIFFERWTDTNATSYISIDRFYRNLQLLDRFLKYGFNLVYDRKLISLCVMSIILGLVIALYYGRRIFKSLIDTKVIHKNSDYAFVFLNIISPLSAIVLFLIMIIDDLYLWQLVIAPVVFATIGLFQRRRLLNIGFWFFGACLIVLLLLPQSFGRYKDVGNYFNYENPTATCIENNLPSNQRIGYSTFSDSRRIAISSKDKLLLIQINAGLDVNAHLTNKKYSDDLFGTFYVINTMNAEPPILRDKIIANFGQPSKEFRCGTYYDIVDYSSPAAKQEIKNFYIKSYQTIQ